MRRRAEFVVNCVLLVLAALLFALCQPNFLSGNGFPLFAYIALVPLLVLARRVSLRASFLWGAACGALSYCLFAFWLSAFHPLALYVTGAIYFLYLLVVVPALKLVDDLFPRHGFIAQWALWIGYEYLKTVGFTGFSYGVLGYSQWRWTPVIQIASVFGVWGVSALVAFPSAWLAGALKERCAGPPKKWLSGFPAFARRHALSGLLWCVCFLASLAFGFVSQRDWSKEPSVTVALVQPASDPWHGGIESYRRDFSVLKRLSDQALREHPETGLVVWPETAFIPRIEWHYRFREDPAAFELVSELLEYLDGAPVPFVLGNDDAVLAVNCVRGRVDYNAALLFRPGVNVIPPEPERYRKTHLVPFTEYFPYRKTFPWVYDVLERNDTHFWERGREPTVFRAAGLSFSTPICFEDTFGYLSRRFVNAGARAIVNLSNDAWAHNLACQYQHLSMAVFRAVENRVPVARSTASGQTCIIDPNGRITAMAEPFVQTALVGKVPVLSRTPKTVYRVCGNLTGVLFAAAAAVLAAAGLLTRLHHLYDN